MGAKTDERGLFAEMFAAKLADVQLLAQVAHLGETRVSNMGVVCPHDGLGTCAARLNQMLQRLEHMRVAQVPGFRAAVIHDAIIALGGGDQARVLRCVEEAFAIVERVFEPPLEELPALRDHQLLASPVTFSEYRAAVCRRLLLPRRQAAVSLARNGRGL